MQIFLAQILTAFLSYGNSDILHPIECEQCSIETAFDTNVHVEASISYPKLPETSLLVHHANEAIRKDAHERYDAFVQEMGAPQDELYEEDGAERTFRYGLHPVFFKSNLISFQGSEFHYLGGSHGSVRYITKTFWQNCDTILELSLDDIIIPESREWLFQHC